MTHRTLPQIFIAFLTVLFRMNGMVYLIILESQKVLQLLKEIF